MTPFLCSNCGAPCDCDYLCPGCHGAVCDRCVNLGNEMKMLNRTFRCAKCKELATKRNEKEASMNKDGGAAFLVQQLCKNCGKPSGYHTWVTRKCPNGITYEEYDHDSAAILAEDAEREGKDENK